MGGGMILHKQRKAAFPRLSLRPAEEKDCTLLWHWRNDENTRKWSLDSAYIPYEEHRIWFLSRVHSADTKILIVLNENKKEIGQVRFDISCDRSAEIDISINVKERGKGYGSHALRHACQYAFEKFNIAKVIAHIKEENQASIRAFTKAGFIFINIGSTDLKGHKTIKMILNRE